MNLHSSPIRKSRGFTIFDVLCFVAACAMIFPVAIMIGNYFDGYRRVAVFFAIMLIVYPVVGFVFAILLRRLFRYFYNRSNKYPYRHDD
jgi:hypothetical protein